jgi:hypothetical protein
VLSAGSSLRREGLPGVISPSSERETSVYGSGITLLVIVFGQTAEVKTDPCDTSGVHEIPMTEMCRVENEYLTGFGLDSCVVPTVRNTLDPNRVRMKGACERDPECLFALRMPIIGIAMEFSDGQIFGQMNSKCRNRLVKERTIEERCGDGTYEPLVEVAPLSERVVESLVPRCFLVGLAGPHSDLFVATKPRQFTFAERCGDRTR